MNISVNPVGHVEILTLQDNYIDILARDNNDIIYRAVPLKGNEVRNSVLAEHGFQRLYRRAPVTKKEPCCLISGFQLTELHLTPKHWDRRKSRSCNFFIRLLSYYCLAEGE
ncbi:MAG: hypothetical protein K9J85_01705 [Desulfobacteraceae bacterium]|nr:hypothetical protein [Desulfobacteraceae bacterium]